jgi:hypothetical protein
MPEIAICHRQAGVPELRLDDVDRNALGGELGRVRVPQAVEMDAPFDPRPLGKPLEERGT